jgi:hypothetical protein
MYIAQEQIFSKIFLWLNQEITSTIRNDEKRDD